jgi:hypothetical protein
LSSNKSLVCIACGPGLIRSAGLLALFLGNFRELIAQAEVFIAEFFARNRLCCWHSMASNA